MKAVSMSIALLIALHAVAGAAANIQDHRQIPVAHTLQSSPAKYVDTKKVQQPANSINKAALRPTIFSAAPCEKLISCKLVDKTGRSIKPSSVTALGNDLYFLGPAQVWRANDAVRLLNQHNCSVLVCTSVGPTTRSINNVPVQEFCDFTGFPLHKSLIVLEKSGDLLEFNPVTNSWHVAWPNKPITYSPDPDFISLTTLSDGVVLLDPERNELWKFDGRNLNRLITPEVLPWKVHRSKINLADGLAVCQDQNIFVLKRSGTVTELGGGGKRGIAAIRQLNNKPFGWLKPTRICNGPTNLLIIDREHNAVVELNKHSGAVKVQSFPADSDLRGIYAVPEGFYVINGDSLAFLPQSLPAPSKSGYVSRNLDARLKLLRLPIHHSRLPYHPGVWPGARRLYRYGVHKGVDFFYDTGCGIAVKTGTPVCAAADGKIIRIDNNFKDLSEKQYAQIMKECVRSHNTSDRNEDLLRGCQVWIDHGNGLITKYAHLDHVNSKLHKGDLVKCGNVVGYVGVSGTGENLPGRLKQPHLHFEVWLDGNYLGYGLTPAETIAVFERIFGCHC
jgi:murein DD-endopeptidase MepM/ murein hydrolase activator NlpD